MTRPLLLAVMSDADARTVVADALERRYGTDYDITAVVGDVAPVLGAIAAEGRPIAFVIAPVRDREFPALSTLPDRFPTARRIALVGVGDTSVASELNHALTLGAVDYYVGYPWTTPEEELYPVTGEALRAWSFDQQLRYDKATIIDAPGQFRGGEIASWLARNTVAASFHSTATPAGSALAEGELAGVELPAVLLYDGRILGNPSDADLAEALGAPTRPSAARYDVTIVGAGPAGLAAAVYAAAEGMRTLLVEKYSVGGQAGTSAKIRNYLGFRWGISGTDLAAAASRQAEQLGAEIVMTRAATALRADGADRLVTLSSGDVVPSGAVIVTGGVAYRQLGIRSIDNLIGRGVFYGAGASEIAAMKGRHVCVLGAGNSAGQAACALAANGADVTILVRGDTLGASMSDYLVQQVAGTPNIVVLTGTQVRDAVGEQLLEGLVVTRDDAPVTIRTDGLFVFIGARPHTGWLADSLVLDEDGFVVTGRDLPSSDALWLETSMSGVFAAGDIRRGSIKRVAAAVGEGSTAAMLARDHVDAKDIRSRTR